MHILYQIKHLLTNCYGVVASNSCNTTNSPDNICDKYFIFKRNLIKSVNSHVTKALMVSKKIATSRSVKVTTTPKMTT